MNSSTVADRGLSRRSAIKRAAAAGAVVWSAPLIIDSLGSPAGAATVGPGNYCFEFSISQGAGCTATTVPLGTGVSNTPVCIPPTPPWPCTGNQNVAGIISNVSCNNAICTAAGAGQLALRFEISQSNCYFVDTWAKTSAIAAGGCRTWNDPCAAAGVNNFTSTWPAGRIRYKSISNVAVNEGSTSARVVELSTSLTTACNLCDATWQWARFVVVCT